MPEYVVESGASARARARRRRSLITILVLLLGLFFAFWFSFSYYTSATNGSAAKKPEPTCAPVNPKVPSPATTRVNVYNSTSRAGLAAAVGKQLTSRGFNVLQVANDPAKRTIKGAIELHFGPAGKPYAEMLAKQTGAGTALVQDKRGSAIVDVVLGTAYTALAPAPTTKTLPPCTPSPTA